LRHFFSPSFSRYRRSRQTQSKAPDSEKIENIRRLIKVTRGEDMRDAMVNQFLDALKPMFANAGPADVRSRQLFNRFSDLLFEEFRKMISPASPFLFTTNTSQTKKSSASFVSTKHR
jgi:hypothetical protein